MTLDQELASTAFAGAVGGSIGAVFAYEAKQSYPVSIALGAAGFAGIVLLYEEVKREAAEQNLPEPRQPSETSPEGDAP